ncbi:SusC/RagA family TonB-linked outer membrane protein [Anditalea andensis]|uniref:TonB-dependent receptor plug domain-containing protein n=1 Tax=Anditalea andensis TaxID=1048983 RepID=A0A074L313_9BACT|nr:TonB-dependent receptor [Anditalea andensis]KEO74258.1 hypothetical protein EL17_08990 [Anditalea andensis]
MIRKLQRGPLALLSTLMWVLLLQFCLVDSANAFQQPSMRTVSGTIISAADGEPLPGVNLRVRGTYTGVVTDMDGNYTIEVPPNAVLIYSFIGFETREISVGNQSVINVTLEEDLGALDEVVVIGYGETKRRDLIGAVSTVRSEDLIRVPTHNALEGMQGRAAGLDITRSSGQAGAGVNIVLRGNRSIGASNNPLYIIDGFQGGNVESLNPNDIESIEVLKDASATAIYGAQGANGVIIVTTKRGTEGKTKISYDSFYGVNGLTPFPNSRTGDSYIQLRREAFRTTGDWNSPADDPNIFQGAGEWEAVQNGQWINWIDEVLQDGSQQSHNISVSGGSNRTKAFVSAGYFNEKGLLRNDDFTRFTARWNVEHEINNRLRVGTLGQMAYFNINRRQDVLSNAMTTSPLGEVYNELGEINRFPIFADQSIVSPLTDERGPNIQRNNTIRTNIMLNAFLEYKPIEGLTFRSNFGTNLTNARQGRFDDATSFRQRTALRSVASSEMSYNRFFNWDNILTYTREMNDHSISVTGVTNYIQRDIDELSASGIDQILSSQLFYNLGATAPESRNISSGYTGHNMMSYAARVNYTYRDKYMLTVTNRYDGASRLAPGNKWAMFPSVGLGWVISDEAFMDGLQGVSFMKLRATHGLTGNSAIPPYGTQSLLIINNQISFGEVVAPGLMFGNMIGNANVGWEKSETTNLGLDLGLWDNRLNANIEVYNTNTTDLLLPRVLPFSTGVREVFQNIGATRNRGVEVTINSENIRRRNFTWSSIFTFTHNKEEITQLVNNQDIITDERRNLIIGSPIESFYTWNKLGIWQINEADEAAQLTFGGRPFQPGDIKLEDLNGDGVIDADDRMVIGSTVPEFFAGFQNTFRYKSFDLGLFFFARVGQTIHAEVLGRFNPGGEGNGPEFMDYWTPENPTNDYPRPRRGANMSAYEGHQTLTFVDGSFIKLRNVNLGYTLPPVVAERLRLTNLRIYATANNMWTRSRSHLLRQYDPERGGEEGFPLNRQIILGVNIGF